MLDRARRVAMPVDRYGGDGEDEDNNSHAEAVDLYAVEAAPSVSGSIADHRFEVKSSAVPDIAYQLAKACGVEAPADQSPRTHGEMSRFQAALRARLVTGVATK